MQKEASEKKSRIIEVDAELLVYLKKVKEKISYLTYDALKKISWKESTRVLAKILKEEKIKI